VSTGAWGTVGRPRSERVPTHGTRARYVSRTEPCRCADCTRANTDAIRAWRRTGSTIVTQPRLPREYLTGWPGL